MKKPIRWLLVMAILAAGTAAVLIPRWRETAAPASQSTTDLAPIEAKRAVAVVVEPQVLVETLATSGTIRANEQIELVSEISGKVKEILFEEGSVVRAGETLVRLDDREVAAEHERAIHRLELAQLREERQQELVEKGLVSQDEYDLALSQLLVLKAELALAEIQLSRSEIKAPFSGVIGFRYVSHGTYLAPRMRIATLQDIDPVKIEFTIPEAYAGKVGVGEDVEFRVKGNDTPFGGRIYAIEPNVDPETRSLRLRAQSPNPEGKLLPGAFADLSLVVRRIEGALAVPSIAVIPELGGRKVFVYEDGIAVSRQVRTGIRSDTNVQILAGVEAGETVLVSGLQGIRAGDPIQLIEAEMAN